MILTLDSVILDGTRMFGFVQRVRWLRHHVHWPLLGLGFAVGSLACTEEVQVGRNFVVVSLPPSAGGAAGQSFEPSPEAGVVAGAGSLPIAPGACVEARCGSVMLECGNCIDDDEDGVSDAADAECLGPCDDSEQELSTGSAARVNGSCRTDCYFDRNSGGGDDGCGWSYRCDPLAVGPDYPPTGLERCAHDPVANACELSPAEESACQAGCLPLTPNGCDCFGCCELPAASGRFIWLGSESLDLAHCELRTSDDPALCRPCTQAPGCRNDCAECELCVGKRELPASCSAGLEDGTEARPLCPTGRRACDPESLTDCTRLEYCITGCCVPLPR